MFDADNEWIARIHAQFQHFADVQRRMPRPGKSPEIPTREMLAEMLEVAFWASLTTNEGRPTRVRIAMVRQGLVDNVLAFRHPVPYTEEEVAELAPAAWSTGSLAVDVSQHPSCIWGISLNPIYERLGAITIDVADPGTIRVGFGPFQSFVVFAGRATASPHGARDLALTARLRSLLGKDLTAQRAAESSTAWRECLALGFLARMVLEDRHGGTLLVVPHKTGAWIESLKPFTHEFVKADTSVRESIRVARHQEISQPRAFGLLEQSDVSEDVREAMFAAFSQVNWHPEGVLRPIARLAAIDGAVVLTAELDILGFGAMINVGTVPDVYLVKTWPQSPVRIDIEETGGTRHQSAVRFVGRNRESIALVISHDGHLSLAHWSPEYDGVQVLKNAEWWI
jgi:hypothetical protein